MEAFIKQAIEKVVHNRRVAESIDQIETLALQIHTLTVDLSLVVRLLGGTKPATERGKSAHGQGRWGSTDASHFATDIPRAFHELGLMISDTWCAGTGMLRGPDDEDDCGLMTLAREIVGSLSAENSVILFTDLLRRISLAAELYRTRKLGPADPRLLPDLSALIAESKEFLFDPVISEQDAQTTAAAVATQVATAIAERFGQAAELKAGAKRAGAPGPVVASKVVAPGATAKKPKAKAPAASPANAAAAPVATGRTAPPAATPSTADPARPKAVAWTVDPAGSYPGVASIGDAATAALATTAFAFNNGPITKFVAKKGSYDGVTAVQAFDRLCREVGLQGSLPCGIMALDTQGCKGAPNCGKCKVQDELAQGGSPRTPVPAGIVNAIHAISTPATCKIKQ